MARIDLPTREIVEQMRHYQTHQSTFFEELIVRAGIQQYTEARYNDILALVKEIFPLTCELQVGDMMNAGWATKRDELLQRARRFLMDD